MEIQYFVGQPLVVFLSRRRTKEGIKKESTQEREKTKRETKKTILFSKSETSHGPRLMKGERQKEIYTQRDI